MTGYNNDDFAGETNVGTWNTLQTGSLGNGEWGGNTGVVFCVSDNTYNYADYPVTTDIQTYTAAEDAPGSNSFLNCKRLKIKVINGNDNAPVFTSATSFSINEGQTEVGTVIATDADGLHTWNEARDRVLQGEFIDTVQYSSGGADADLFVLDSASGELTFKAEPAEGEYLITVIASDQAAVSWDGEKVVDGPLTTLQAITVNVLVDTIAPVFTSGATFSVTENQTAIGTVTATDANSSSITFTVSGSELAITSAGVLSFVSAPDYETKSSYTATVTVTDGTYTAEQVITVNVTDVNDAPVFTSGSTFSAAENQTAIGTVTATDADSGDSVTFTVSGSELMITSVGVLTFVSAPDYETKATYTATVTATDGTDTTTQSITVNVTDVNDNPPAFTSGAIFNALENQLAIGTVTATVDRGSLSFSVSGSELLITSGGVLSFVSAPDYETKSSYTATVTATDGTNESTQSITVNVTDASEAPVFTSSATFNADENQTAIGAVSATDADGDTITFTVSGSELAITSGGVLSFVSAPDYETKSTYTATVIASDALNETSQDIRVDIEDIDENPTLTVPTTITVHEFDILYHEAQIKKEPGPYQDVLATSREACSSEANRDTCVVGSYDGVDLYSPDYDLKTWKAEDQFWFAIMRRIDSTFTRDVEQVLSNSNHLIFAFQAVLDDPEGDYSNSYSGSFCDLKYPLATLTTTEDDFQSDRFCKIIDVNVLDASYTYAGPLAEIGAVATATGSGGPFIDPLQGFVYAQHRDAADGFPVKPIFMDPSIYLTGNSLPGLSWQTLDGLV
ncbi:MAG: hypothetical protein ACKVJ2_13115, partial [Pseudomonadales bacterium]